MWTVRSATDEELNQLAGNNVIGDLGDLEGRVSQNESDIAKNAADINSNAADIATNAAAQMLEASSNDQDIAALDSRVDALENAPTGLIPQHKRPHRRQYQRRARLCADLQRRHG